MKDIRADITATFTKEGDTWWIQCSHDKLLLTEDPVVQQLLKIMGYKVDYLAHKHIKLTNVDGVEHDFYVYPNAKFKAFELTLDELSPIYKVEPVVADEVVVSTDSLKLGMRLGSVGGAVYTVVGYNDQWVFLSALSGVTTRDGTLNMIPTSIQIPVDAPTDKLSLKDFKVVE